MASTTSFKQQCPSCEAMVPIRDPGLIGRKIDCPKCKYRFVVEKPEGKKEEDSSDTPAPTKKVKKTNGSIKADKPAGVVGKKPAPRRRDDEEEEEDERPKKKKKSGGLSMTVMLGAGLGILALGLLVVGGIVVFGGGKKDTSTPPSSSGSTTPGGTTVKNDTPAPKDQPPPKANLAEPSNLLPNDSEAVVNYQIESLYASGIRDAALKTPGAFNEAGFKNTFGFPLFDPDGKEGVTRVITAINNTNHWVFTVLRTKNAVNKEKLIENLQLDALPVVNGMTAYSVKRDLDSLSNLLIKANRPHPDLQVCMVDGQTLVFADPAPMDEFLKVKGKPEFKSQPTAPPAPPAPPGGNPPMTTPGGTTMPMPGGTTMPMPGGTGMPTPAGTGMPMPAGTGMPMPGGTGMPMPGGTTGPGGATPPPPKPLLVAGAYLTIEPAMKAVFDKIEASPVLFSIVLRSRDPMVEEFTQYQRSHAAILKTVKGAYKDDAAIGKNLDQVSGVKPQDMGIELIGFGVTGFTKEKTGGAVVAQMTNELTAKAAGLLVQAFVAAMNGPGGPNGTNPPGMNPGGTNPPGMNPGGTNPPGMNPGGTAPPMINPAGTAPPMINPAGTAPPGMNPGGTAPPGMNPGGTMSPGMNPGGTPPSGFPGNPGQGQGPVSVVVEKETITLVVAPVAAPDPAYRDAVQVLGQFMVHLKGAADMASSRSHIHDLAAALQKYAKEKGHFPMGAAHRDTTADRFLDWIPSQRISWMAEMLPYLGDGDYRTLHADAQKSWQEGDNLHLAGVLIPQFISRGDPTISPIVRYPGVPEDVAATHFVGVAGVGMDAADYPAGDVKDGVFGYNRETKLEDIKDGLDKTIVLLQIPANQNTPWLAGGGATVRGVSEAPDSVRSFVCAEYNGKRGTFAVMADGKVRFIPETIDPNLFRAMCTIAGGASEPQIDKLDEIAPVVPGDAAPVAAPPEKTTEAAPMPPVPGPEASKNQAPPNWIDYGSKEGGYSIWFPQGKAQDTNATLKTPNGEVVSYSHVVELATTGSAFGVTYSDIPSKALAGDQDVRFDNSVASLLAGLPGAKLTGDTKLNVSGYPARELVLDTSNGRMKQRMVQVKGRMYVLSVAGKAVDNDDSKTFVESFRLTAK